MKNSILYITLVLGLFACKNDSKSSDASGSFEAIETIVSSEANGRILSLNIKEGETVKAGEIALQIDSALLVLKRKQLEAMFKAILSKRPNISSQIAALEAQLKQAQTEQKRLQNLLKSEADTQQQKDNADAQVQIIQKKILGIQSTLNTSNNSIDKEAASVLVQIEQVNEQLSKYRVKHPISGTVLSQYVEVGEFAAMGRPLYKIADLNTMILRAYVTGDQFSKIKIGQKVKVLTDDGDSKFKSREGTINWISDKAEFTPKTIQTKDERANLVYAIKVGVKNDGAIKIGMYGELKF